MERFGPYVIHQRIGAGGMATVDHATLELDGGATREVALKRLLPALCDDKQFVADFVREAKLVAQLDHPNIARILELGRVGNELYIAMELVRGHSLMSLMRKVHRKRQQVPVGIVTVLFGELCDTLEYAYEEPRRIVHRDLTPSNLLLGDDGHLKVVDFGVAKAMVGQFQTSSGLAKGKIGYMSDEAIAGRPLDGQSDLFSAGVVMWELLTGRRLFRATNEYEVIVKIRAGNVARPSKYNAQCPSELDDIVLRALAVDREERWPSAGAMRAAIDEVRRYYRASVREVIKWKRSLRGDSSVQFRSETTDPTAIRLSTDDLVELEVRYERSPTPTVEDKPPFVAQFDE